MMPKKKDNEKVNKMKKQKKKCQHSVEDRKNTDNISETSVGSDIGNPSQCGQCSKLVKNDDSAMECEICEQ